MLVRDFVFERETKRTYRFIEVEEIGGEDQEPLAVVGIIYVQKWVFDKQPTRIRVSIEEVGK